MCFSWSSTSGHLIVCVLCIFAFFFFSSRRRHTRFDCDWSSDVCSSDLTLVLVVLASVACALQASHQGVPAEVESVVTTVGEDAEEGRYEKIYNEAEDRKSVV